MTKKITFLILLFHLFLFLKINAQISSCPEVLDQSNTIGGNAASSVDQWQSFTASKSGSLTKVEFKTNGQSSGTVNFTFKVFSGGGTTGALISQGNGNFNTTTSAYFPINFPVNSVNVTANSVYTCEILISTGYNQLSNSLSNTYAEGSSNSANYDLVFNTYITSNNYPIATISKTNNNCFGGTNGSVNLAVSSGTSPYTYMWSNNATTKDITNLAAGTFTFVVKDVNNCQLISSVTISEPNQIPLSASTTSTTICAGATTNLSVANTLVLDQNLTTGSGTGYWFGGNSGQQTFIAGQTGILKKIRVQTATYGAASGMITAKIYSGSVGSGTLLKSISYSKPANTNSWDDLIFTGTDVTLTAGTSYYIEIGAGVSIDWVYANSNAYANGQAYYGGTARNWDFNFEVHLELDTYTWNPGAISGSTVIVSPSSTTNYTVTRTSLLGCTSSAMVTVNVNNPNVTITNPSAVCSPSSVDITAPSVTQGSTSGLTYTYWADAGASTSYATPTNMVSGTYYIKGTDALSCFNIKPVVVKVNASPAIPTTSSSTQNFCSSTVAKVSDLSATVAAGSTIIWYNLATNGTAYLSTIPLVNGTTYYASQKVTGNPNCESLSRLAVTVIIDQLPTATAGGNQKICSNGTATVTGASSSNGSILWTHNGKGVITSGTETTLNPIYTAISDDAGNIIVLTMTVTSNNSCGAATATATATYNITVEGLPTAFIEGTQTICSNEIATVSGVNTTNGTISWTHNGTGTITPGTEPIYTPTSGDVGNTVVLTMTVTSNNSCSTATESATYTINFYAENTVSAASSSPTLCINTPLSDITHTTSGATDIGTVTGLPVGITASFSFETNKITISGTPTEAGTFNYSIPLIGGCGSINAIGTIIVNAINSAGASSSTPSICVNSVLTNITHTTSVASGIGLATGLPADVTASFEANTITISGTPSAPGTFNYSIPLTGGCGSVINATGTIIVTSENTVTAASSSQTLCINTAITNITHTTTGATGISNVGVSGADGLPAGVTASFAANTITISGTPSASGVFNYSIPLTGGCGSINATGTIIVTSDNTVTAASSSPNLCIYSTLTNITHTTNGVTEIGTATGLPAGVTASFASNTITISGTPSVSGIFNYSIPLTGGCGGVNATGTIIVTSDNTVTAASSSPTLCIYSTLTNITHTTNGVTEIGTATGLPAGVTASFASNTITISGTPTVSGVFNYSIPLTGGCGSVNATGTITVLATNTAGAASSTPTLCINTALTPTITHATTGATGIGVATGIPTGVTASYTGDANSGTITLSGAPTAFGTFNYTIPLTGGCVSVKATGTITVTAANTAGAASSTPTLCINTALTPTITHATTGATGIGVATGIPTGVTASYTGDANSGSITLSGTPTAFGTFNYTIPLTGGCGGVNATGAIIVTSDNTVTAASSSPTLCIYSTLTNITHTTNGVTEIGTATGFPAGVTASFASNTITISGTPSVSGIFNYSIPLTGGCGGVNATGTIIVTSNNTVTAASSSPTLCIYSTLTNITHTTNGVTEIGTATGLPAGVTASFASNTITISGTPTASGTFNYSIPLTGGCGGINATGTLTILANPSAPTSTNATQAFCSIDSKKVSDLTATGTSLTWYNATTLGTAFSNTDLLASGTYYASQTVGSCESDARLAVAVIININPTLTITHPRSVCYGSTIDITASAITNGSTTGLTFSYFTDAQANSVHTTPETSNSGIYFIKATNSDGCFEIKRVDVSVNSLIMLTVTSQHVFNSETCDGSMKIVAKGGNLNANLNTSNPPYTYSINNGGIFSNDTIYVNLCNGNYSIIVKDSLNCSTLIETTLGIKPSQPLPNPCNGSTLKPTISSMVPSQANVCAGKFYVNTTGGKAPYRFNLENTASTTNNLVSVSNPLFDNLCIGNYNLTVIDSLGCNKKIPVEVKLDTTQVTNPCYASPLAITFVSTNSKTLVASNCNGSLKATISGVSNYTYEWSNNLGNNSLIQNNLCPGNYKLTVTSNGCSKTETGKVNIGAIQNPCTGSTLNASIVYTMPTKKSTCVGKIGLNANGGAVPYSFSVKNVGSITNLPIVSTSPNFNDLCAGMYAIEVKDSLGCVKNLIGKIIIDTSVITTNPCLTNNFTVSMTETNVSEQGKCDGVLVATVNGATNYTYTWSNNLGSTKLNQIDLCPGTYKLKVTSNGCSIETIGKVGINIPINPCVNSTLFAALNTTNISAPGLCDGSIAAVAIGGQEPYEFTWNTGETNTFIGSLCYDTYRVVVKDAQGCLITATGIVADYVKVNTPTIPLTGYVIPIGECGIGACDGSASTIVYGGKPPYTYLYSNNSTESIAPYLCSGLQTVKITDALGDSLVLKFIITSPENTINLKANTGKNVVDSLYSSVIKNCAFADYNLIDTAFIKNYNLLGKDSIKVNWEVHYNGQIINVTNNYAIELKTSGNFIFSLQLYCPKKMDGNFLTAYDQVYILEDIIGGGSSAGITSQKEIGFKLYPNPFKDYIIIVLDNDNLSEVFVSDIAGKEIFHKNFNEQTIKLDLNHLSPGSYLITIKNNDTKITRKIVKD